MVRVRRCRLSSTSGSLDNPGTQPRDFALLSAIRRSIAELGRRWTTSRIRKPMNQTVTMMDNARPGRSGSRQFRARTNERVRVCGGSVHYFSSSVIPAQWPARWRQRLRPNQSRRSRKSITAAQNRSLRSPATMWPASATSTNSAWGTVRRNSWAVSSLTRSLRRPLTSSVGRVRCDAASSNRPVARAELSPLASLNSSGSQCHRQRPSGSRRRFLRSPAWSSGRGRCGW